MKRLYDHEWCIQAVPFLLILVASLAGCSRPPEPTFVVSDETTELPSLHQQNIATGLRKMFGTPMRPRLLMTLPAEKSEEADSEDSSGSDDAEVEQSAIELVSVDRLDRGAAVYSKRCVGCHGASGDGKGPAAEYLRPRPRDYRQGVFKFTSTPYGQPPARQDLVRTIRRGAKGTSMPAFPWMSKEDLDAVIDYVIYLSLRGRVEGKVAYNSDDYDEDEVLEVVEFEDSLASELNSWNSAEDAVINPISAEPGYDLASAKLGRELFIRSSCYNCHGSDAKGQTEWLSPEFIAAQADAENKVQINYDKWGHPAPAANITARMLHGGRRPLDIYRRIYTGISGTPMPEFGPIFADDPDAIWHMTHYVMHIADGGDPTVGISVEEVQTKIRAEAEATKQAEAEAKKQAEAEATKAKEEADKAKDNAETGTVASEQAKPDETDQTAEAAEADEAEETAVKTDSVETKDHSETEQGDDGGKPDATEQ